MKLLFILLAAFDIFCDGDIITRLKSDVEYEKARTEIVAAADKYLKEKPVVITDKPSKFVKDTHYYVSLCIYWWPDEKNPGGPYVRRDGFVNPETKDYDSPKLTRACDRLDKLALAYYLTRDAKYSKAYREQLGILFLDRKTYMYPNLDYGQIRVGHNNNKGTCYGIIQAYGKLTNVVENAMLMESLGQLDVKTVGNLKSWFAQFANWLKTSDLGLEEARQLNNHSIAYDVLLTTIAAYGGDMETVEQIRREFRPKRLEPQIEPDGRMPLELARTRALHYSVYNLEHIVDFCRLQERLGVHYYSENKELIDRPFKYLFRFVGAKDSFPYQEVSSWEEGEAKLIAAWTRLGRLNIEIPGFHPEVFGYLDLNRPGLEAVREKVQKGDMPGAAAQLLAYYRARPEVKLPTIKLGVEPSKSDFKKADDGLQHRFFCGKNHGDPSWYYGEDIDWQYWPVKDIEKRVGVHRLRWWLAMGKVYNWTKDEKYAKEWTRQFSDWLKKNPYIPFVIDQGGTFSSGTIDVDSPNECFVWRPLDCSVRLQQFCQALACFVHSEHFTPAFLTEFLYAYYLNAAVMRQTLSPGGNHLLFEAWRLITAGLYFPEFKDAESWIDLGFEILNREASAQIMPDGCQYELDPAYQYDVLHIYQGAFQLADMHGLGDRFTPECLQRYRKAIRYGLEYLYPDGTGPCFSDCRADNFELKMLAPMADKFNDDVLRWFLAGGMDAVASAPAAASTAASAPASAAASTAGTASASAAASTAGTAPDHKTAGFPQSGFYTFRSGWDRNSVIMPFKATERGMWHAQPDFGTFEIYAYGHLMMPDAGCYTYSGDAEIERWRAYFKASARHNTLTLDDRDFDNPAPKVLEWQPNGAEQRVVVEHEAYAGLTRRRSIAFVDEKFFVVLDEVKGPATGVLALRNGFGEGEIALCNGGGEGEIALQNGFGEGEIALSDKGDGSATVVYRDGDCGLVMALCSPEGTSVSVEKDWYSRYYLQKKERPMVVARCPRGDGAGVQRFVSVFVPYRDGRVPDVKLTAPVRKGSFLVAKLSVDGEDKVVKFQNNF